MKGSEFVKYLPQPPNERREEMIFDAVRRRDIAPISWAPVVVSCNGYTATFLAATDALRVGDASDSIRVNANHQTAQLIADELGLVLPTPKLSDEIWAQAPVKIKPQNSLEWVEDNTMTLTKRMVEHHHRVEKAAARARVETGEDGLIADVGKDWVTTKKLWEPYVWKSTACDKGELRSANYGWHQKGAPSSAQTPVGGEIWQPAARCHGITHADYSQVIRLVRRDVQGCGPGGCWTKDIEELARDPEMSCLVSAEGPLPGIRHPQVAKVCTAATRCPGSVSEIVSRSLVVPLSCDPMCVPLPPPEPDPTANGAPPPKPSVPVNPPLRVPAKEKPTSYAPAVAGALVGFGLTWLWVAARS